MMTMTRLALCEDSPHGGHFFTNTGCRYCGKLVKEAPRVTICASCHQPPTTGLVDLGPYSASICQRCADRRS